jgi:NAD(P)-dependent dehydrogenase (short-subunit alcohol dehydrogenase family)
MSEKKVALVTGANKGLGFEIARQLGQLGHAVIVGSRDEGRGAAAADALRSEGIEAESVKLDVSSADDIAALPGAIQAKFGRLDVLVNNAGVQHDFEGEVTADTMRRTYEANVFGPYAIGQALMPLLKQSPAGRIVNHSSILGSLATVGSGQVGEWGTPAYTSSKAALNMITVVWANQLKGTNVKVNSAHPGWVKTDLGTDAAPLEVAEGAQTAVRLATLPDDGPSGEFFHGDDRLPW